MAINGRIVSHYFKENNVEVRVVLHDNTRDEKAQELLTVLQKQSFVSKAVVITKAEAAEQMKKETNEDFMQLLDGKNPLYTSIKINLHSEYVNADSINRIKQFLMQSNIVRDVQYQRVVIATMNRVFNRAGTILGIIALILLASVIIIIDNTVRLAMFSNRLLIKTMQMVGATRWFIARPFDKQAIVTGLLSGIIAIALLMVLVFSAEAKIDFIPFAAIRDNMSLMFLSVGVLILGVLISVLSTHRSVIKYLKLKLDDLY
jgi:cell division transport system permease protein